MSKFLKYFSVIGVCFVIMTYALWVKFYSEVYGSVVFSAAVPENNLILVPTLDSGRYRIHLTGDGKKCQLTKGGSCVIFKNISDKKCLIKINNKETIGQVTVCGTGTSDRYMDTMGLIEFDIEEGAADTLIDIVSLTGDSYRPVMTLTKEPSNEFVKWIHPNYGVRSIFVYFVYLLYTPYNLWIVIANFLS